MKAKQLIPYFIFLPLLFLFADLNISLAQKGSWVQKKDFLGVERVGAVGFSIGNKGYIGTGYDGNPFQDRKDFWQYDPVSGEWAQIADFGGDARNDAVGFSIGDKGYVGTGVSGGFNYLKDFWEYNPGTNRWIKKTDFKGTERYGAVGFSIGNKGYIGTGASMFSYLNDFWEYDPVADDWIKKADFSGEARYFAVGFSIGSKGYIGTGGNYVYGTQDFREYDPVMDQWAKKKDFKGTARVRAVGFSIGNKGYLGTGFDAESSTDTKDFWEYDQILNEWNSQADLTGDERDFPVGFSIGNKGYIGTGKNSIYGTLFKDFWEFTPSATTETFSADVYVIFNDEHQPLAEISVDNGSGMKYVGSTGPNGEPLRVAELSIGSKLFAEAKIYTQPAAKSGHEEVDNTMFELWFDSDSMKMSEKSECTYEHYQVLQKSSIYNVNLNHPVYKYNLVITTKWDVQDDYYKQLVDGLKKASQYFYDATDGQAYFKRIVIYDNDNKGEGADVIIHTGVGDWFRGLGYNDDVGGIDNKWWFEPLRKSQHIHMSQYFMFSNLGPDDENWYHGIIHEFGHYGFALYDEYLNGDGINWAEFPASFLYNWNPGGTEHPVEYGIMQKFIEFSSHNDYLKDYPENTPQHTITLQYQKRKKPCWSWIAHKWKEYYPNPEIIEPPFGWYPDKIIPDRSGPDNSGIMKKTEIIDKRSSSKSAQQPSINQSVAIVKSGLPVYGAEIYKMDNRQNIYWGQTDRNGEATVYSVGIHDTLLITQKTEDQFFRIKIPVSELNETDVIDLDKYSSRSTTRLSPDPGVVASAGIKWTGNSIALDFSLIFDQVINGLTKTDLIYAGSAHPVTFVPGSALNEFSATANIGSNMVNFDGTGTLEVTFSSSSGQFTFNSDFKILPFSNSEYNMFWQKSFNFNTGHANFSSPELGIILSTSWLPYKTNGQNLYPVSDLYSISTEKTNTLADSAGMNIYYSDADISGLDETSLGIYTWNPAGRSWQLVPRCGTGYHGNVVSALVSKTGIYGIFASVKCIDVTPPGVVKDLVAVKGVGQGIVTLTWTAPLENNTYMRSHNYHIRYYDEPINAANWDAAYDISYVPYPLPYTARETFSVKLPRAGQIYYFALKTEDKCGNISGISNTDSAYSSFVPYTFSLLSPKFNDTVTTTLPYFRWEELQRGIPYTYTLVYADNPAFQNKTIIQNIESNSYQTLTNLKNNAVYYWKVSAVSNSGDTLKALQPYFMFYSGFTSGLNEWNSMAKNGEITVYPNPFRPERGTCHIDIHIPCDRILSLMISDVLGNVLKNKQIVILPGYHPVQTFEWDGTLPGGGYAKKGIYIIRIQSDNGSVYSRKILIN